MCVCVYGQTLQTVASVLLMFVGFHLLKSLQHHRPFAVFNNIYGHAAVDIVVFAVSIYAQFRCNWHQCLVSVCQERSFCTE